MIKHEINIVFSNRINRLVLLFLLVIAVVLSIFAVWSVSYVDKDGNTHNGLFAARQLTEAKAEYAGKLNSDIFEDIVNTDKRIKNEYGNKIPENIYANNMQKYTDIKDFMVSTISYGGDIDYTRFDALDSDMARNMYAIRDDNIVHLINEYGTTEEKIEFLKKQYSKLVTPFDYAPADSWITMGLYATTYAIILIISISFITSGIFSEDFKLKAESVFFSTKLGRSRGTKTKIVTGLFMATIIYWGAMLILSIISFAFMGVSGANSPIQIEYSYCMYNYTFLERYFVIMLAGYVGSLLSSVLTMLVSAKTHSPLISLCVPMILFVVSPFIGRVLPFDGFFNITPDQLINVYNCIKIPLLYQFLGNVVMQIPMIIVMYSIIVIITIPFIYSTYSKCCQN